MKHSPAMSVKSDFSDMDDEALELYLATCVPLSNLPTPPPAKEQPLPASLPTPPLDASVFPHHSPELDGQCLFSHRVLHYYLEVEGMPSRILTDRPYGGAPASGLGNHFLPTNVILPLVFSQARFLDYVSPVVVDRVVLRCWSELTEL
jgi:hypothetical protein